MKKVLLALSVIAVFAACSKDDDPIPQPPTDELIHGDWAGAYYVKTGFIEGEPIEMQDSTNNDQVKLLALEFFESEDGIDSINGTSDEAKEKAVTGIYALDQDVDPNVIDATLDLGDNIVWSIKGDVALTQDSLIVTEGKKEEMVFGDETADSTVTVYAFKRAE